MEAKTSQQSGKDHQQKLSHSEILKTEMVYELGKTISAITLKRFFEDQFSENAKTDLRFIKTLDKLCIFLDFENLNDFVAKQRENIPKNEIIKKESFDDFKNIIKDCGNEELNV